MSCYHTAQKQMTSLNLVIHISYFFYGRFAPATQCKRINSACFNSALCHLGRVNSAWFYLVIRDAVLKACMSKYVSV